MDTKDEKIVKLESRITDLRRELAFDTNVINDLHKRIADMEKATVLAAYTAFVERTAVGKYDAFGNVTLDDQSVYLPLYASIGLAGETGEFLELIKKWMRDPFNARPSNEKLTSELGDVIWYVTRIASQLGLTLDGIISYNKEKIDRRNKYGKEKG